MPIIDLKNVTVYFEDGYSEAGAINLMAGYMPGATSIVVDGITGIIPVGARFRLNDADYQVVSTMETTGNTTTIVFTPGLVEAAADNDTFDVFGVFLAIKVGDGNITFSEKKPREFKLDRGRLDQVRNADEVPMDVSIQLSYEELTASSGDPPTPSDALKRRGAAASWVSTNPDPCAPYCLNIRLDHIPPGCENFETERVIIEQFYYEQLDHDPKAGTIACTGKSNKTEATVTRLALAP